MKTIHLPAYSLLAMVVLFCTVTAQAEKAEYTKKKEINKSFNVSVSDLLQVDNRYGNITITHWSKNEVSIQVIVEAKAGSEERAQASVDRVNIEINKSGQTVSAITSLKSQNWNGSGNERLTINYFINIPSKLNIDLAQKYGNIHLPEKNEGRSTLLAKYGNINGGSFTSHLNLESAYGNVELENIDDASFDLSYCGNVSFKNAETLSVDSKYSNLKLGNIKKLDLEQKYGNLKIEQVDKANIECKYSDGTIDYVVQELNLNEFDYSKLNIKELASGFSRIYASARYSNLNIGIPTKASFSVSAEEMKYGNLNIKGFDITKSEVEDKVNHYKEINGGRGGKIEFDGNNYSNLQIRNLQ